MRLRAPRLLGTLGYATVGGVALVVPQLRDNVVIELRLRGIVADARRTTHHPMHRPPEQ
jgi:hypothetical protein